MIIKTKDFKEACTTILVATQGSQAAVTSNELEIRAQNRTLLLSVANAEYNATVKFPLDYEENFHATVNADLFLKLISQITTEDMSMEVLKDNSLHVSANGKYKLPLIFNKDQVLEVQQIQIQNPTVEMDIDSEILQSIYTYNSKELQKGTIKYAIQRYYYIDELGCITFTTGACINSFSLDKPLKLLLTNKVVKLFKLFKEGPVKFTLGYDPLSAEVVQTKISFENAAVKISAILSCDDTPVSVVPVKALRGTAEAIYPCTVNLNRNALLQAINRLLLFNNNDSAYQFEGVGTFVFSKDNLTIWDMNKINTEQLNYSYCDLSTDSYEALLNLSDLKTTLETITDTNITISFGDHRAFVIRRNNITVAIPECKLSSI